MHFPVKKQILSATELIGVDLRGEVEIGSCLGHNDHEAIKF